MPSQTVDKKLFFPPWGRIALFANERIAEFLDFAIQAKFAYINKLAPCYGNRAFFCDLSEKIRGSAREKIEIRGNYPRGERDGSKGNAPKNSVHGAGACVGD